MLNKGYALIGHIITPTNSFGNVMDAGPASASASWLD